MFKPNEFTNPFPQTAITGRDEVEEKLRIIDPKLSIALFKEVAFAAQIKSQEANNPFYALNAASISMQMHLLGCLRERLASNDWSMHNSKGGSAFAVSPCKKYSIVVFTGTDDAGREIGNPTNKAPKGAVFEEFISQSEIKFTGASQILVLLFHKHGNSLQMELSTPSGFRKRKIQGWYERLLFPDTNLSDIDDVKRNNDAPDTDIVVERKKKVWLIEV